MDIRLVGFGRIRRVWGNMEEGRIGLMWRGKMGRVMKWEGGRREWKCLRVRVK